MKSEHKKLAEEYFNAYPKEDVLHISDDGQVFLQSNFNDGVNHQRRIEPKNKLATIYRKELIEKASDAESGKSETPDESWTNKDIKAWLDAAGAESKGNKTEMLAKVQAVLAEEETDVDETGVGAGAGEE